MAIAFASSPGAASPVNLLTNGDFETGDLSGWTTFLLPNGEFAAAAPPPGVEAFDTNGDGSLSSAARLNAGTTVYYSLAGGGILQTFTSDAGVLSIGLDFAVRSSSSNVDGGLISVVLDGSVLDSTNLGSVDPTTYRGTLEWRGALSAGTHELRLQVERKYRAYEGLTTFLDNAFVVPEPGSVTLLGLGLLTAASMRRRCGRQSPGKAGGTLEGLARHPGSLAVSRPRERREDRE